MFPVLVFQLSKQQAILRAKKQPRTKNKPQRSPAKPLATPLQVPQNPLKKSSSRPNPPQNQSPHRSLTVRDLWGTFFGLIHFLTRACFLSRRMAWVSNRTVIGQPPQLYSEPSEPYSDKETPLTRASRRLLCQLGSQLGIHRKLGLSPLGTVLETLVAHDCGYPLSRYTCRATRVAADFLDFRAFCRCSSGVAPHPLNILVSHLSPPHSREVSHRNLGLKRCRATRGCRSYNCGCRATLCN